MRECLVIGVGNALRGDDGAGIASARLLKELRLPDVRILETRGEGLDLMTAWANASRVIVVDAAHSGAQPGTLHFFDAGEGPLPARLFGGSTHTVGLGEAIELSRALGQLPRQLWVYGVEGESFGMGESLSPKVTAALPEVVQAIKEKIDHA